MHHSSAASEAEEAEHGLKVLRDELDATDAALLEALRRRLDICRRIGELKGRYGLPMMQPHRIGAVQDRAARFAQEHGISAEFLRSVYDTVISETCRLEDEVIARSRTPEPEDGESR